MKSLMWLVTAIFALGLSASDPLRVLAILENERVIEGEPGWNLREYLNSTDPVVQQRAVLAAARIGNDRILPDLQPLLKAQSRTVRMYMAFALGQIRSKDGIGAANLLLRDPDAEVRRLAIEALGRIGGLEVSALLIPLLDDADVRIREQAALSLALVKDKDTVQKLIEKARANDPAQWSYVYALYRLADERSTTVLHEVIARPVDSPSTGDPSAILFALKALWSLKKPLVGEELARLLQHSDQRVWINALDVAIVSPDKSLCSIVDGQYEAMPVIVRWKALDFFGAAGCLPRIEEALKEKNATLRGAAIVGYTKIRKKDALPLLEVSAIDRSWVIRMRTAEALAELEPTNAKPFLRTLSHDSGSAVRLAALDSLAKFIPETSDTFVPLLQSKDFAERATAADALGKTRDFRYLPDLIHAYEITNSPAEVEARLSILDALTNYTSSRVLDIFVKALSDPAYTVRRHAIDGLKKLNGPVIYLQGDSVDVEHFAARQQKISAASVAKYPAGFGTPVPDYLAQMKLQKGLVVIRLLGKVAPLHVLNFKNLAERGFYDGLRIHRVVPNFVIQGGDPRGDGWGGGSDEILNDQFDLKPFKRGSIGMPTAGKDTGGSQFFITMSRQPHLDGNYTVFGEVISGMEFVDSTEIGDTILKIQINPAP
jgi:cyclophilin family peptidyl-prolyl cis-trans isomerase/HEAT repeat protein